jgi:hypothetical protein
MLLISHSLSHLSLSLSSLSLSLKLQTMHATELPASRFIRLPSSIIHLPSITKARWGGRGGWAEGGGEGGRKGGHEGGGSRWWRLCCLDNARPSTWSSSCFCRQGRTMRTTQGCRVTHSLTHSLTNTHNHTQTQTQTQTHTHTHTHTHTLRRTRTTVACMEALQVEGQTNVIDKRCEYPHGCLRYLSTKP